MDTESQDGPEHAAPDYDATQAAAGPRLDGRSLAAPRNGRPMPGTRVQSRHKIKGHLRAGVVLDYEWDWNSCLFPVQFDFGGVHMMLLSQVDVITTHRRR